MVQDGEFKRGWPILAAAAVGVGLGLSPLPFYTIGVMIPPLLGEFGPMGWSAGDIFGLATNHQAENIIYSTVGQELSTEVLSKLNSSFQVFELNQKLPLPIVNAYSTPATLGKDRLAAA